MVLVVFVVGYIFSCDKFLPYTSGLRSKRVKEFVKAGVVVVGESLAKVGGSKGVNGKKGTPCPPSRGTHAGQKGFGWSTDWDNGKARGQCKHTHTTVATPDNTIPRQLPSVDGSHVCPDHSHRLSWVGDGYPHTHCG